MEKSRRFAESRPVCVDLHPLRTKKCQRRDLWAHYRDSFSHFSLLSMYLVYLGGGNFESLNEHRCFVLVTFSLIPGTIVRHRRSRLVFLEKPPECEFVERMQGVLRLRRFVDLRHALAVAAVRSVGLHRIEIRRVFGMAYLGDVMSFGTSDHEPVDAVKEGMVFDVIDATDAKSLVSTVA